MELDAALARVGVRVPDILLPRRGIDLSTWAVVACDQFTSQPEYWERVAQIVDEKPSTLRLIFPEAYLEEPDPNARITSINSTMRQYLEDGLFESYPATMVLVRRANSHGAVRWGLITALDLECYSWEPGARTLIRATEGTILDRLPPRVMVREAAAVELPHIMVLMSDNSHKVIEPLAAGSDQLVKLYDIELMLGGGRVTGWAVSSIDQLRDVANGLGNLLDALDPADPLLFAMGDGNHSFATAKSIWENVKPTLSAAQMTDHPARYCLVELENIHDPGLEFEPIHRVLFGADRDVFERALAGYCAAFTRVDTSTIDDVLDLVKDQRQQSFGYLDSTGFAVYRLDGPVGSLAAGTLQRTIDSLLADKHTEVDYIHGTDVTEDLGRRPGNLGLLLPPVAKDVFFASIMADGALPRKTFSLGEAEDKRYYLEARRLD